MDFNKIIEDMKNLQSKVDLYEAKEKVIVDAVNSIQKDISKLEKKIEKETNEINKEILKLKILITKEIAGRFQI